MLSWEMRFSAMKQTAHKYIWKTKKKKKKHSK